MADIFIIIFWIVLALIALELIVNSGSKLAGKPRHRDWGNNA